MTLIKKTCVLSKHGVRGYANVIRVADSVGVKIVFDGYADGLYAALKIGYDKPLILKLTGQKSEFSISKDISAQDEISCIISDGKTIFAEGGRAGALHPSEIVRFLEALTEKTGKTEIKEPPKVKPEIIEAPKEKIEKPSADESAKKPSYNTQPQSKPVAPSSPRQDIAQPKPRQEPLRPQTTQMKHPRQKPPVPVLSPELAVQMMSMAMQLNTSSKAEKQPYQPNEPVITPEAEIIDVIAEEIPDKSDASVAEDTDNSEITVLQPETAVITEEGAEQADTAADNIEQISPESAPKKPSAAKSRAKSVHSATKSQAKKPSATESVTESMQSATESDVEKQHVTESEPAEEPVAKEFSEEKTLDFPQTEVVSDIAKDSSFNQSFLKGITDKDFYLGVKNKLEELFIVYPRETRLEKLVPSSKWVKINYDEEDYYVTGVLSEDENVSHIVYGVPAVKEVPPPKGMEDICDFLPVAGMEKGFSGYYLIFQDINTGEILPR